MLVVSLVLCVLHTAVKYVFTIKVIYLLHAARLTSSASLFLLCKRSSHTFSGGSHQRGAGGSGAAGLGGATRTGRRLGGRDPGGAAEEASGAQSPEWPQPSPQAGAAPVRTRG